MPHDARPRIQRGTRDGDGSWHPRAMQAGTRALLTLPWAPKAAKRSHRAPLPSGDRRGARMPRMAGEARWEACSRGRHAGGRALARAYRSERAGPFTPSSSAIRIRPKTLPRHAALRAARRQAIRAELRARAAIRAKDHRVERVREVVLVREVVVAPQGGVPDAVGSVSTASP